MVTPKPYVDIVLSDTKILRTFDGDADRLDFVWHRDVSDRVVEVISGNRWQLQIDNELPVMLEEGNTYRIPAMQYHRLIKGDGELKIAVEELL